MRLRLLHSTLLLALIATPAFLRAQDVSSAEEERLESLSRSDEDWVAPKNSITVGFRMLASGGTVHFGNLGAVPFPSTTIAPASSGAALRTYQNGYVGFDAPRSGERDSLGNQTSTPGGRYQTYTTATLDVTDANGNVSSVTSSILTGDFPSYTPGLTRVWSYDTPQQAAIDPGYIGMSTYGATSGGGAFDKKGGPSSGIEMQLAHVMGKLSKRMDWSLVAGIALNGINNKTSGDVNSTLNTKTDFFSLNGQPAPFTSVATPYSPPVYDPNASITTEITTPLGAAPDPNLSTQTAVANGVVVHGRWQVKGAYFMVRFGPSIHAQLTERLGLSASVGLAGAFASSYYTVDESMALPDVGTAVSTSELSYTTKFLSGYYADLNMDWTANDRTGVFGGLGAQKLGAYNQTVGDRTANVDLGSTVGLRGGVNIKF